MLTCEAERVVFPLARAFAISRGSRSEAEVVECRLADGDHAGRGECVPYARYGESVESVLAQIRGLAANGGLDRLDRETLAHALPPGAARNAVDCALWDLEAKRSGKRVWELAGLPAPEPEITAYTLSLDHPERMRAAAEENAHRPLLKIKLGGEGNFWEGDFERVNAVREGAPNASIICDANEGWIVDPRGVDMMARMTALRDLGVEMVEQPLPAGADDALDGVGARPITVCADESCHDRVSLFELADRYDMVNIKLDKTGGLTEALALREEALEMGYQIMVGCMIGSSLGMAPAQLVAQGSAVTDLDGPLLLAEDRPHGLVYDARGVHPPARELWG